MTRLLFKFSNIIYEKHFMSRYLKQIMLHLLETQKISLLSKYIK